MKEIIRHLTSMYMVNAFKGILGLISIPIAVHYLGNSNYGIYSIYITIASYIVLIELGTTKNLSRLLARDRDYELQRYNLQNTLGIYVTFCIVLLALLPIILYVIPNYIFPVGIEKEVILKVIIVLAVIEYIISIPTTMTQALCIAEERFESYAKFSLISGFSRYGLMFTGFLVFQQPHLVVLLLVLGRLVDFLYAKKLMGSLPKGSWYPRFSMKKFKSLVGDSFALSVAQLFQLTVITIGSVIVNKLFGLHTLGVYRSAFDTATKVWFFSNAIGLVVFPRFVRILTSTESKVTLFKRLPSILRLSWTFYIFISIVGTFLAPFALKILGLSQSNVHDLFIVLLLGVCINAHANLSYEFLQASGKYWVAAIISGLSLILMIIGFYSLFHYLGLMAIGWSWVISQIVYALTADILTLTKARQSFKIQSMILVFYLFLFANAILIVLVGLNYLSFIYSYLTISVIILIFIAFLNKKKMQLTLLIKGYYPNISSKK